MMELLCFSLIKQMGQTVSCCLKKEERQPRKKASSQRHKSNYFESSNPDTPRNEKHKTAKCPTSPRSEHIATTNPTTQQARSSYALSKYHKEETHQLQHEIHLEPAPVPTPKRQLEDFHITGKIGTGTYGRVYTGCLKKEQNDERRKLYAIKELNKQQIHQNDLVKNLLLEKSIMVKPDSSFIAQLVFSFRNHHSYYLVMDLAQGGDVFDLIDTSSPKKAPFKAMGQTAIRFIIGCVVMGLEYLHSKSIIYQDLKPQNLLVFKDGYVKLTDFGLSEEVTDHLQKEMHVGTPEYFAPEMLLGKQYNKSIDLWALGVLAYELANFCLPFVYDQIASEEEYVALVKAGQKKRVWKNHSVHQHFKSFVGQLLQYDPEERLGVKDLAQLKKHPFFKVAHFDWEALANKKLESPLKELVGQNRLDKCLISRRLTKEAVQGEYEGGEWDSIESWSLDLSRGL